MQFSKIGQSNNVSGYVDSIYPWRVYDAWGDVDAVKVDSVWKADEFTVTATGTSPITAGVLSGTTAVITTGATEYNGDNIQIVGSRFKLEAGKPVYFGAKLAVSDATQSDLLVGLCGVDTTLTAVDTAHAVAVSAGGVAFTKIDAVTAVNFQTYTTATLANTASALTLDTSAHIYEFFWDGESVTGYVDGVKVACFNVGVTAEILTPSIAFRSGSAGAKTCTLYWMRAFGVRS